MTGLIFGTICVTFAAVLAYPMSFTTMLSGVLLIVGTTAWIAGIEELSDGHE